MADAENHFSFHGIYLLIKNQVIPAIQGISSGSSSGATAAEVQSSIEAATNLNGIEPSLTNIEGFVDNVEGLISTLDGVVDNISGNTTTISSQLPAAGPISTSTLLGTANQVVVKASAGILYGIVASHTSTTKQYLQIFNEASVRSNTNVPLLSFPMPAASAAADGGFVLGAEVLRAKGLDFSTGIVVAYSTTRNTLTLGTASEFSSNTFFL